MSPIPPAAIALFSMFLYNCINALFAYLTNIMQMSMLQLVTIQAIPSLSICCLYTLVDRTPGGLLVPDGTRMAVWGVAIFSTLATLPLLFSLQSLTLSENVTVNCLLPFITALMAWLYLGERFTKVQAVCCLVCVAGVVMLADPFRIRGQPDADDKKDDGIPDTLSGKLFGICVVLLGMILRVPQFILVRQVGDRATTVQILTITYLVLAITGPVLMLITRESVVVPDRTLGWSLIGALVTIWIVADGTITYAGQRTSPTTVTICGYAGVIFSNCIQWAVYGNHPSTVAFIGMSVVLVAGLYGVLYGPAVDANGNDAFHVSSESSALLQEHGDPARRYSSADGHEA